MQHLDPTNPYHVQFMKEVFRKTTMLKMKWIHENKEMLEKTANFRGEPKNYFDTDVIACGMKPGLEVLSTDMVPTSRNRRKKVPPPFVAGTKNLRHKYSIVDAGLGDAKEDPRLARPDTDLSLDPIMRPIDPKLERIIYKAPPNFGRNRYLKYRNIIDPEDKYYFPECSSWDYGWRLRDTQIIAKRQYARCWHLTKSLKCRSGPQPDPEYRTTAEIPTAKNICGY